MQKKVYGAQISSESGENSSMASVKKQSTLAAAPNYEPSKSAQFFLQQPRRSSDTIPSASAANVHPTTKLLMPKNHNEIRFPAKKIKFNEPTVTTAATANNSPQKILNCQLRCFTGTIERILQINKSNPNLFMLYEIFGKIHSIRDGKYDGEKIILLRNKNSCGAVLETVFYETNVQPFGYESESFVRCIGKFITETRFHIYKISPIYNEDDCDDANNGREITNNYIQRLHVISQFVWNQEKKK